MKQADLRNITPNQSNTSPFIRIFTRISTALLGVIVAIQTGCVTTTLPPKKLVDRSKIGNVVIAASRQEPKIKIGVGAGESAGRAAGKTAYVCGEIASICRGGGEAGFIICLPFFVASLGCLAVGPPVAALAGAGNALSSNERKASQQKLLATMDAHVIQDALREKVTQSAADNGDHFAAVSPGSMQDNTNLADYRTFVSAGVDTVLEVAIAYIGLDGSGKDSPLTLTMIANSRLVRTSDNSEIFSWSNVYQGRQLKLTEWYANQAEQLKDGLNSGSDWLGKKIYADIFAR